MMDKKVDGYTWEKVFRRRHDMILPLQQKRQKLLENGLLLYARENKRQHFPEP